MHKNKAFFAILTILSCFLHAHGADKYTDENRPYEFGFNIDGEQHRHEKKDENGLIMGEFGFITADGVYHVTVYATDENGNFKILSMKNLRVKPYPTAPAKKGHSLHFPPSQQPVVSQEPSVQQPKPISIEPPGKACSHCSLPTTSTLAPQLTDLAVVSRDDQVNAGVNYNSNQNTQYNTPEINAGNPEQNGIPQNYLQNPDNYPQQNYPHENYPQQNYAQQNYPQQNYPQDSGAPPGYTQQGPISEQNYPQQEYPNQNDPPYPGQNLQPPRGSTSGERNPKQFDGFSPQPGVGPQNSLQGDNGFGFNQGGQNVPNKPMLISAQMQIVDKNTDIYHRGPGEREGLPNGLTKDDMMLLLYTFNYTVGFHAHHEEGYTNGVKKGYYYVTGRNGVRTRIDYVADDTGFHPKISQEVLDLLSEEVPKPDTEKDERYGLKGYEFKWLYYPPDSKRR